MIQKHGSSDDAAYRSTAKISESLRPMTPPAINPWTLTFKGEVEQQHVRYYEQQFRRMITVLCLSMVVVIGLASAWNWHEMGYAPARIAEFALLVLLSIGVFLSKRKTSIKVSNLNVQLVGLGIVCVIVIMAQVAIPERRPFMVGLVYLVFLAFQVLPLPYPARALAIVSVPTLFIVSAYRDGIYSRAAFSPVVIQLTIGTALTLVISYMLDRAMRQQFILKMELEDERRRSEVLLHNVLPASIAARLRASGGNAVVDTHPEATVLFADIVGFTSMAAQREPAEVVEILNHLFSRFDAAAAHIGVEKIKTIGDSYMAVAGLPTPVDDSAGLAAELALEIREAVRKYSTLMGLDIQVRIGVHTGPVAAGIIGTSRFLYDLWGDTVNLASRLESTSQPGEIQVSMTTKALLEGRYRFREPGVVQAKGFGDVQTAILVGPVAVRQVLDSAA